jgi:hypothetical protein
VACEADFGKLYHELIGYSEIPRDLNSLAVGVQCSSFEEPMDFKIWRQDSELRGKWPKTLLRESFCQDFSAT